MTKPGGGRDPRHEPDEPDSSGSAGNLLVDRVYAPRARTTTPSGVPPPGGVRRPADTQPNIVDEPALRRQLSRLQRQLAEAQLELSRKDDELAGEVEKRLIFAAEHARVLDAVRRLESEVDDLSAYRARTSGVEQRVLEAVATAEELSHERDRERAMRATADHRVVELQKGIEEVQQRWKIERALLEQQHHDELERFEANKRHALEQAEEAIAATTLRLREINDDQLRKLHEAHERAMAALRGELEPQVVAARDLAAERARLVDELAAVKAAAAHAATERDETHRREVAQQAQSHATQQETRTRLYTAELARVESDRDAKLKDLEQAQHAAKRRELAYEDAAAAARDGAKRVQVDLAESKEHNTRIDAARASAEERLAAATAANEKLVAEQRALQERFDASAAEARRNAVDRKRFAAYLEEGLALIGALPPQAEPPAVTPATTNEPAKE